MLLTDNCETAESRVLAYPHFKMFIHSCRPHTMFTPFVNDTGADFPNDDTNTAPFQSLDEGDGIVVMQFRARDGRCHRGVPYIVQHKVYCCGLLRPASAI